MPGRLRKRIGDAWRLVAHSLSGRLLLLTLLFVMITEVVIFFPSIGRYHRSLLESPHRIGRDRDPALHRGGRRAIVGGPAQRDSGARRRQRGDAEAARAARTVPGHRDAAARSMSPIDLRNRQFLRRNLCGGRLPPERRQSRAACDCADAHQGRRNHRGHRRRGADPRRADHSMPSVSCCWRCCCRR